RPQAVWSLDRCSVPFCHVFCAASVFPSQRPCEGLLSGPSHAVEPLDVVGSQIVLDQASVFPLIGVQDGIIRTGCQRGAWYWLSCLLIGSCFLYDHVFGDTQGYFAIHFATSIGRQFVIAVLRLDAISKEASFLIAGVGDESLFLREGQPEL